MYDKNQNKGYGNKQGNQNRYNQNKESISLPEGYLKEGYFTDVNNKEKRDSKYIVEYAKSIAAALEAEGKGQKNNSSQIRKYYDYGLRVQDKLQSKKNDFTYVEADIAQFVSTVSYAKSRGVVTKLFEEFLVKNVDKIEDEKDYYAFMKHFEAVIAFMKK